MVFVVMAYIVMTHVAMAYVYVGWSDGIRHVVCSDGMRLGPSFVWQPDTVV